MRSPLLLLHDFIRQLRPVWQRRERHLGIAISGGADSMALASLASQCTTLWQDYTRLEHDGRTSPQFTGIIVDHALRNGSRDEARQVADELRRMNIESHVVPLDWSGYQEVSKMPNVESLARTLRYQALGNACLAKGIRTLLLAHHKDDQAETILCRILGGYVGTGLSGMQAEAPIPECNDVYGVPGSVWFPGRAPSTRTDFSHGVKDAPIRCGGVKISRPLLGVPKSSLVETCKHFGARWFEDHTNADPTFTLRNAVRLLHKTESLPLALRRESLLGLASRVNKKCEEVERSVQICLSNAPRQLDLRSGTLKLDASRLFQQGISSSQSTETVNAVRAGVAANLLEAVSPKSRISPQQVDTVVDVLFQKPAEEILSQSKNVQVGGTNINCSSATSQCVISRANPYANERKSSEMVLFSPDTASSQVTENHRSWTSWRLWDNRFWIRVSSPLNQLIDAGTVSVRFWDRSDQKALRGQLDDLQRHDLESKLRKHAPGSIRMTLPTLVTNYSDSPSAVGANATERIVALPSLDWSGSNWAYHSSEARPDQWLWDIRYKSFRALTADFREPS